MGAYAFFHLVSYCIDRIQAGHRFLKNHGDLITAYTAQRLIADMKQRFAMKNEYRRRDIQPAGKGAGVKLTAR